MSPQAAKFASIARFIVADDHPIVADGLRTQCKAYGLELAGEVTDPNLFEQLLIQQKPDVAVVDISFGPGRIGGLDLLRIAGKTGLPTKLICYSQFDEVELITEAYQHGASCFLSKAQPSSVLAAAIRRVHESGRFYPPGVAERMADAKADGNESPRQLLDERCFKVFVMTANGVSQEDIAKELGVSLRTITNDMTVIKEKLNAPRINQWAAIAVRYHLMR
jgi:two-component system invasion response regulator UvrY